MANPGNKTPTRLQLLTREQAGVVSRRQAVAAGITPDSVKWRVRSGTWQQVHLGVYATFTGPLTRPARLWAALVYAGPGAILSHHTAAELLGLTNESVPLIHVTIPNSRQVRAPRGVAIHVSRHPFPPWRFARGIPPHTMTEGTLIDLVNAAASLDEAVGWITAAFARRRTSELALRAAIRERSRVRWRTQLDEVITLAAGGTHSVLEFRYDRDVERAHRLPPAARQVPFRQPDGRRGFRDRCYQQYGVLVVELDGRQHREQQGQDRRRDNQAAAGGAATLRYDWTAITRQPCETAAEVFAALRERGYQGTLRPCSPTCRAAAETA